MIEKVFKDDLLKLKKGDFFHLDLDNLCLELILISFYKTDKATS